MISRAARLLLGATFLAQFQGAQAGPALPVIPNQTFYATNYGAVGDGVVTNTSALQAAINAASASALRGGTVEVTPGVYLSGPLTLASSINLQLDAGAVLRMLPYGQYPGGITSPPNFLNGSNLHDVELSGAGAIDGQGLPWWQIAGTNSNANRPLMVNLSACTRVLIQNTTLSNSPSPHLVIKGKAGNVTISSVTLRAPSSGAPVNPSHNTDGIDLAETNCLIQNCNISVGDDNVALGSSASISRDIVITNCAFGDGHGVSIGSYTSGGVSNLLVISCTFSNTDQGIRIKSDRDRGGVVQNLTYCNLSMSNVTYPILIYGAYTNTSSTFKAVNNLTPAIAATYPTNALLSTTPIYRDIVISNVTGTAQSGRIAGLIWGLPEMLVSNVVLANVNLAGSKPFGVYYASGVEFIDSQINTPAGVTNVSFYNSQLLFSNSLPANPLRLDGYSTSGIQNELAFFNTSCSLLNTNALGANPHLALAASTFTLYNNLSLGSASELSFVLGSSPATIQATGNLTTAGAVNITAGPGFTNGIYTLLTYGQHLDWTPPLLETLPPGYNYAWDTNTPNQVRLLVSPLVSLVPTNMSFVTGGEDLRLEWPADHLGWHLQVQTNPPGQGLGTNWTEWPDSAATNVILIPLDGSFGSAFFRLKYP